MRTPVLVSSLLTVAVSTGCGGGNNGPGGTVQLDTIGPPELVAFREQGAADWQTLPVAGNLYEIDVAGPYFVAVVCNDVEGLFDSYQFARTPDDDPAITAPCTGQGPDPSSSATGTMVQPGDVSLRFSSQQTADPDATFDLPTFDGTHDLVAFDDTRIVIRRGLQVAGTTAITPAIDLATEGAIRTSAGFTIANASTDESLFGVNQVFTENETFVFLGFGGPEELLLAPDSALGADDRQSVSVSASLADTSRQVSFGNVRQASSRTVTFPEALTGATLEEIDGQIGAEWGALPDHDTLALSIDQTRDDNVFLFHDLTISKTFADQIGTSVVLDLDIPGFDPEGLVDVTTEYSRSFSAVRQRTEDERASSRLQETVNAPSNKRRVARLPHAAIAAKQQRR